MTPPTLRQRLRGLAATLVLLLLVIGTPLALITIGARPWDVELDELRRLLSAPDDGTLALIVVAMVAWIAWVVVAVSVVVEAFARIRGLPAPSLPGLRLPQYGASQLVAVAALLFMTTPTVYAAFTPAPVPAPTAAPVPRTAGPSAVAAPPVLTEAAPVPTGVPAPPSRATTTIDYTVKRGDSLWRIAERLLGTGGRYTEIVELNREILNGRPDFVVAGTVLKVPKDADVSATDRQAQKYEVQPGDTLSEIAETQLGDPLRYPDLFDASRDTIQRNGTRLTDPDLIQPGWTITIPGTAQPSGQDAPPADEAPPEVVVPPTQELTPEVDPTPTAEPEPEPTPEADGTSSTVDETPAPGWLLPGLTGAGALLAALVLLAVRAHRNTQLRYRRPGHTIAPPPPELRSVEKTAMHAGAPMTATIEQLDQALRALAADTATAGRATPRLVRAVLTGDTVTLHLAEDSELTGPWAGTGEVWSTRLRRQEPSVDVIAPYPLLVSIGQDDAGGHHLLNLEAFGVASLTGDTDAATALARHIAAELALNPWSVLVNANIIGFGHELADLDTLRLHHHDSGDKVITSIARDLATAQTSGFEEPDPFWAVVTTGDGTDDLAKLLTSSASPRLGAALVTISAPVPGSLVLEVDSRGRLHCPALGLDVQAAGLTALEASACAAIVDLTRESEAIRIPATTAAPDGWEALTDHAGAVARTTQGPSERSLLPRPVEEYVDAAATTAEDVVTLAPIVPQQVRRQVEQSDPTLDQDLADWFDTDSARPRLTLLGPVNARAHGALAPAIAKRKPYFVELLAFLALHPEGVTGSAVADAFSIAGSRARTDLGSLRAWLGQNHQSGHEHLPPANDSPAFRETGVKAYQVQGVLVDLDLFRRLRARGQARGAEGISDFKAALSLVEGVPFSHLRERGWSWLLDSERLHETIGCAIVDTAHVIVLDALAKGDLAAAREAAETACKAAPYDDICRLDLVKVTTAEGHADAADRMLVDDIYNRADDYLPPVDLPERTRTVVEKKGWNSPQPGSN